jgi:arabinogalactan oligomer/maltooligosaccharide transport system permease protein
MAQSFRENWYAYAYVAPAVIGTAVLVFGPFLFGIGLGFFTRVYSTYEFVGLQNFIDILSNFSITQTKNFYRTLVVTVMWTVINVSLHVSIGLGLAMLLKDRTLRFTPVYRTLLVVPWALPNYITALIWKGMFNKEYGAINIFLALFGIEPVSWFNSFWGAFTANVVTNVWLGFPFMMVISLGALQSIPAELYEAAEVDGAGRWDRFRRITLPLLKPALFPAIILGTIWTFNQFNVIYLVSGGAPNGETDILITEAYRWAFEGRQQYGYAAAYSTIIFFILFGYTYVTNRITRSTEGAYS